MPTFSRLNRYVIMSVALFAIVLAALLLNGLLNWRAGKAFDHIQLGYNEKKVISYMGAPSKIETCGEWLWWDGKIQGKNEGRCVKWARYNYLLSSWAIGYSADNHVVSKYHYVSE